MVFRFFHAWWFLFASKARVDAMNEESIRVSQITGCPLTIFLHGFLGNYTAPYWAMRFLKQGGIPVVSIGYDYRTDIATMAEQIKTQIDALRVRTGLQKINVVGISLGGSAARYYIEKLGGKDIVLKLVTIFTPVVTGASSKFDRAFLLHSMVNPPAAVLSIKQMESIVHSFSAPQHLALYGTTDWIVDREAYPLQNVPPSVTQVAVAGGHLLVSYDATVFDIVGTYLLEPRVAKNHVFE